MPEEQVDTDAGKSTDTETVQIDKAELEGLRANQEVVEDIKERAINAGFSGVKDYVEQTEVWAYEDAPKEEVKPAEPDPEGAPKAEAPKTAPAVMPQTELDRIQRAEGMATAAFMQTSYTSYDLENKGKPEAERSKYSRDDLLKVINGPRGASVQYLSSNDSSFGGNVYAVADFILNQGADSKRRQEEAAKSNKALNKAEETAKIDSTTVSAPAPQDDKSDNDKAADEIAPDDVVIA